MEQETEATMEKRSGGFKIDLISAPDRQNQHSADIGSEWAAQNRKPVPDFVGLHYRDRRVATVSDRNLRAGEPSTGFQPACSSTEFRLDQIGP